MSNQVITFGCRLNAYESEAIKSAVDKSNHKDLIVFNSCAVTSQAEKQLKQAIRKAARENPEAKIVVTGCAAQINPVDYAKMEEVSLVIGNEDKSKTESYSLNKVKKISKISNLELGHQDHIFFKENNIIYFLPRNRSLLQLKVLTPVYFHHSTFQLLYCIQQ